MSLQQLRQQALQQYSVDLTENARAGLIDPIIGRDEEIRQVVDILMRRRQNNPILTGEAGVGKTAVVEGFALPLVGTAWVTALVFTALNAGVLTMRLRAENQALSRLGASS